VRVAPLLPANAPILRALDLPARYAISNAAELGEAEFLLRLERALQNGLRLLQVREQHLSPENYRAFTQTVVELAHRYEAKVLVNGDVELARKVAADGVHYTGKQLLECVARPDFTWCSASCHTAEELHHAGVFGFDFVLLSPVLPTLSHAGAAHLGWKKFSEMVADATLPVYALGGLTSDDLSVAQQHGAHGIALLRQAWV
jgi:8-oxo-dGTP diphosphatase